MRRIYISIRITPGSQSYFCLLLLGKLTEWTIVFDSNFSTLGIMGVLRASRAIANKPKNADLNGTMADLGIF